MEKKRQAFYNERQHHWDQVAEKLENWKGWGEYYRRRIAQVYKFNIPTDMEVLEIGCGNGDLLASLKIKGGVGIDISPKMVSLAKKNHPDLDFTCMDATDFELKKKFDIATISDTVNDVWDVQAAFEQVYKHLKPHGRLIINFYNRLWEVPLSIAAKLGVAKPNLMQNWLTIEDIDNLLNLAGFEIVRNWDEVLLPFNIPLLAPLCNKLLVHLWPFRLFAMTHFVVARPKNPTTSRRKKPSVSIIVPARNEAGNIHRIFNEMPAIDAPIELVFVEGHSSDNTYEEDQQADQRA